ncbi:MAG: hypothetical protein U5K43_00965 [Halofilum sp. (in: g-proteobacteria)]|nr:hypothetical protein [Halofilum sp. (in: g-proteobacteria)]
MASSIGTSGSMPVEVVEIDVIGAEALQRRLASAAGTMYSGSLRTGPRVGLRLRVDQPALGRDHRLRAAPGEETARAGARCDRPP